MKKKIICILVCMMLLTTVALTVAINVNKIESTSRGWSEKQKLLASDGSGDDRFGCSVDIETYDAIVGAYFDDISPITNCGSAYVFTYGGASWSQQAKLTASDADNDDEFGISVSIDGDYAIVGAHFEDAGGAESGAAYIFYRSGSSWTEQQKLTAGDAAGGDNFGRSVSIDGEYAIVGAPGKNSDQGFAYIFKRSGTTWTQQTKIGATPSKKLGYSVSMSMPYVIMGAYGTNSNTGTAHIYELIGSSWYGKGKLTASDGILSDRFGVSVSISSNYAICGAPGHDLSSGSEGAVYIFEKPTSGWTTMTETQKVTASDAAGADNFGSSASVDGNFTIITSPGNDDSGSGSGSAYIFSRGSTSWTEITKLTASDAASEDYFGWSSSISGNNAIVGAYTDDNTAGTDAGSAYIFEWLNQPPNPPIISGKISGKAGKTYKYTFTSSDPDGDDISYYIDWGDANITSWTSFQDSNTSYSENHTWSAKSNYTIKAKAKDIYGLESSWATLDITMPKNKGCKKLQTQGAFEAELGKRGNQRPFTFLNGSYYKRGRYSIVAGSSYSQRPLGRFKGIFKGKHFIIRSSIGERTITIFGRCIFENGRQDFTGIWIGRGIPFHGWIKGTFEPI